MNLLETITSGKNGLANIEKIEAQLFNVVKVPLVSNLVGFENPTAFGIYKENGGQPLGVVGNDYSPQQLKNLFPLFIDGMRENQDFDGSKLTFHEMKDGKKVRFSVPVAKVGFKNLRGQFDESIVTLNFQTGFDGLTKTSLYLSTFRMICSNGMKASVTEFQASFKNVKGNQGKAVSLVADINRQLTNVETLNEMYLAMNKVEVNQAIIDKYIESVTGYNLKEKADFSTRKLNILNDINKSIDLEFSRTGATAFGLFNGITHYTNHVASGHTNPDFIYTENGAKMNDKALKLALELI